MSTDVLDIHRDKFTSPKPFSPRTMKSNVSSKLISLRCYNPPKRIIRRQSDSKVSLDVKPVMHFKKQVGTCTTNSGNLLAFSLPYKHLFVTHIFNDELLVQKKAK